MLLSRGAAATLEVGTPGGFATVPDALAVAVDGDVIEISPGVYDGPLRLGDVEVELVGIDGSAVTSLVPPIGPEPTAATVVVDGVAPVTLRGLSIDGGGQQRALYTRDADLFGEDLALYGGFGGYGADLSVHDSDLTLVDVVIDRPIATLTGGHVEVLSSVLDFERVTISNANTIDGIGGAAYLYDTNAAFRSCTFVDNVAAEGGALFIEATASNLVTIDDSLFEGNDATSGPGGALFQFDGHLRVARSTFRDSSATDVGGTLAHLDGREFAFVDGLVERGHGLLGGGLALLDVAEVVVSRSSLLDNVSDTDGGGILIVGETVDLGGNLFCGNAAQSGGAVQLTGDPDLAAGIHHNRFVGNAAEVEGAAITVVGGPLQLWQNTIAGSTTTGGRGAVYANGGAIATATENVFVFSVGAGAFSVPPAGIDGGYNLFAGNDLNYTTTSGDETDGSWSNVFENPKFRGYVPGDCSSDLRPADDSPLIDGGDPTKTDEDGTRCDIGAYGGAGAAALLDLDGDGVIDGDCAPFDPDKVTGSEEIVADGIDQDCDGSDLCWLDDDGDGVGAAVVVGPIGCDGPGIVLTGGDCDDTDPEHDLDCTPEDPDDTGDGSNDPELRPAWFCASVGAGPTPSFVVVVALWLVVRRRRG